MTGREYLEDIRSKLKSGRHQNRMGQNVLRAFGYVRRRKTAIDEINDTLEALGLVADPPITTEMPLEGRIIFVLSGATPELINAADSLDASVLDISLQDEEGDDGNLPERTFTFTVSELPSAETDVEWVPPSATIQEAYTKMLLSNYSQLVVASNAKPRQQDIKGIVSFKSLAKALMNGEPTTVGDCIDANDVPPPSVPSNTDLESIISQLSETDVVLVIGQDKRLKGIVTAWDLANEFTNLVNPFKRIEEIETRLGTLIRKRLGKRKVAEFLRDDGISDDGTIKEIKDLTIGELQRVLDFPDHWDKLKLAFDRVVFIKALDDVRNYRNHLMHFEDPLKEPELTHLTNFCHTVREIQL